MNTNGLQGIRNLTVPGDGEQPIEVSAGRFFMVKEASDGAAFDISIDNGSFIPWDAGMAYALDDGEEPFSLVTIRNRGASPITLDCIAGRGRIFDARLTVVSNRTGSIAQEGVDGTGIVPPTGGEGIRGWLSGIYATLRGGPLSALFSLSVVPCSWTVAIVTVQTDGGSGSTWVPFASAGCRALEIVNHTGTAIEYRRGGTGDALTLANGASRKIEGILNANQISVRRVDLSATQVTVAAETFV